MEKIKWDKKRDCFIIDRETLADLSDWAGNIYRNHSKSYDDEDIINLKELLDNVNSELQKYIKSEAKHHKIKVI